MTAIMIYHVRSKYTAVGKCCPASTVVRSEDAAPGRKEIVMFFWLYAIIEFLVLFLDSGIIPTADKSYPVSAPCCPRSKSDMILILQWFAAVYTGLVAATYCCLLINGFVGFQFAEDGTPLSLWVGRLTGPLHCCNH
jgi:hypothetical protein